MSALNLFRRLMTRSLRPRPQGSVVKSRRPHRPLGRTIETLEDRITPVLTQNFDGVTAPALPAGWSATTTGAGVWVTSTAASVSAPNSAFVNNPATTSDTILTSPSFTVVAGEQLTFSNNYNLEATYDGGVLEISINGGAFTDIIAAGGSFVTGGYNGTIDLGWGNPLAGRGAWTGNSGGFITTTVNYPASAMGQSVQLRFRMGSDSIIGAPGWYIDNISSAPASPPPPALIPIFTEPFADNSQGWTLGTEWQIGPATSSSGHQYGNPDPAVDTTPTADNGIAGVVIGGNATTALHGYYYLTSPVINGTIPPGGTQLVMQFQRWLNSDYTPYMQNIIEVWNGSSWNTVFLTGSAGTTDNAWSLQTYNITAYANPNLQVRFGHQVGSGSAYIVSSWNIDDFTILTDAPPVVTPTIDATVTAGNLIVTDVSATGVNNNITAVLSGSNLVLTSTAEQFIAAPAGGTLSNGDKTLTMPLGAFAGSITFNLAGGNDTLIINETGGVITRAITFNGAAGNDTLTITGGSFATVAHAHSGAAAGTISMTGAGLITYGTLETLNVTPASIGTLTETLPAGPNVAVLQDDGTTGNGLTRLQSSNTSFPQTTFRSPTTGLTINRGNAADTITVNAIPDLTSSLTVGAAGTPFAGITLSAGTITTSGAQNYFGATTLTANTTINASSATYGGTVNASVVYTAPYTVSTPAFNFIDISGTGAIGPTFDDQTLTNIPIGFTFQYFGASTSVVSICSNGWISATNDASTSFSPTALPNAAFPNGTIAGWWTDLNPQSGGTIRYQTVGAPGSRIFIAQWTAVSHFSGGAPATFQIQLHETTNRIEVHLPNGASNGSNHSIGVENGSGTIGTSAYFATTALPANTAYRFTPTLTSNGATLTTNSAGVTSFNGVVGGVVPLGALTTNAGGTTAINSTGITTTGAISFGDPVTLGATAVLTSTTAGNVSFAGTVNGPGGLTVNTAGTTTFSGAVGTVTALASLTTDAPGSTNFGGTVTAIGNVAFNDSVTLNASSIVNGGTVTYGNTVNPAMILSYPVTTPTFNFIDISATGTVGPTGDDQVVTSIPIGFNFNYFEAATTVVSICSNGWISATNFASAGSLNPPSALPNTGTPNGTIAGWWSDLNPAGQPFIRYQTIGAPGSRIFIVQWTNVSHFSGGAPVTFQIQLHEGTNLIEVHLPNAASNGNNHAIGVENGTGTIGTSAYFGTVARPANSAFRFTPTVSSNGATLTTISSGATTFNGVVGGLFPLGALTTNAGGNVTVGAAVSTTGATTLNFGGDGLGRTALLNGAIAATTVTVIGGAGADTLTVNTSGTATVTLNGANGGDTYNVNFGTLGGTVAIADTGAAGPTDTAVLTGTAAADTLEVNTTAAGGSSRVRLGATPQLVTYTSALEQMTLNGGAGADTYNVRFGNGPLPLLSIADSGAAGTTDVANLFGTSGGDNFNINSLFAQAVIFGATGERVNYTANLEQLTVNGPSDPIEATPQAPTAPDGGDYFVVTPDAATIITINGGNPTSGIGDTLDLNAAPLTAPITITNPSGTPGSVALPNGRIDSGNRQTVFWNSIETLPVPLGLGGTFDFQTATSTTQPGFRPVLRSDTPTSGTYASAQVGWVNPGAGSFDRAVQFGAAGNPNSPQLTALLRDGQWGHTGGGTNNGLFQVSVAPGSLVQVTAFVGDVFAGRDTMNVYVRNLTTGSRTKLNPNTAALSNTTSTFQYVAYSGMINPGAVATPGSTKVLLQIEIEAEFGGATAFWTISGVDVRPLGLIAPLTINPAATPLVGNGTSVDVYTGTGASPFAELTVSAQLGTIVTADQDPAVKGIQIVADSNGAFSFSILRPAGSGNSTITVRDVTGASGTGYLDTTSTDPGSVTPNPYLLPNPYVQPYTAPASPPPPVGVSMNFDFNSGGSPTMSGFTGVQGAEIYSPGLGRGWVGGGAFSYNRGGGGTPPALFQDGAWGYTSGTYRVAIPNGTYDVRVYVGDPYQPWYGITVTDGTQTVAVDSAANRFGYVTLYNVTASGGELSVTINGTVWVAAGIQIASAGGLPAPATPPATTLPAAGLRLDFNGTSTASVSTGIVGNTMYTPSTGYGWQGGHRVFDRAPTTFHPSFTADQVAMYRDGAFGEGVGTFQVAVPSGAANTFAARIYVGDSYQNWGGIKAQIEGNPTVHNIDTSANPFWSYVLSGGKDVNGDGVLTITISGSLWVMNGIDIIQTAGSVSGTLPPSIGPGAAPQLAAEGAIAGGRAATITSADLTQLVSEALNRWSQTGLHPDLMAKLKTVTFEIADLGMDGHLGLTSIYGTHVRLDDDGAGRGWFVDLTPSMDDEYEPVIRGVEYTAANFKVADQYDLLTVIMHELGHVIGLDSLDPVRISHDLMTATLALGTRRVPTALNARQALEMMPRPTRPNLIDPVNVSAPVVVDPIAVAPVAPPPVTEPTAPPPSETRPSEVQRPVPPELIVVDVAPSEAAPGTLPNLWLEEPEEGMLPLAEEVEEAPEGEAITMPPLEVAPRSEGFAGGNLWFAPQSNSEDEPFNAGIAIR